MLQSLGQTALWIIATLRAGGMVASCFGKCIASNVSAEGGNGREQLAALRTKVETMVEKTAGIEIKRHRDRGVGTPLVAQGAGGDE